MKVSFAEDEQARARFAKEVELLRSLDHINVLRVFDANLSWSVTVDDAPLAFYITELCSGALTNIPRLRDDPLLCIKLFREACDAIRYLHARETPIIHRDIKPENFLIANEPYRIVLSDLGIAKRVVGDPKLTKTHEVVGTPMYRAPESHFGGRDDVRADVYSLGRVLEWLFAAADPSSLAPQPVIRGSNLADEACEVLDRVIAKACAPNPGDRFESVEALSASLPKLIVTLAPEPPSEPANSAVAKVSLPENVFDTLQQFLRGGGTTQARQLIRLARNSWLASLRALRADHDGPRWSKQRLNELAVGAIDAFATTLAAALAVSEQEKYEMLPFGLLIADFIHVADWDRSGLTALVELPRFGIFLSNWVLGAQACSVDNFRRSVEFWFQPVSARHEDKQFPLINQHDISCWPSTLEGNAKMAWTTLTDLREHAWIKKAFGSGDEWERGLTLHSIVAVLAELSQMIRNGLIDKLVDPKIQWRADVVPFAFLGDSRRLKHAWATIFAHVTTDDLAKILGVASADLRKAWPHWLQRGVAPFLFSPTSFRTAEDIWVELP